MAGHDGMWADIEMEKELRVLHLDPAGNRKWSESGCGFSLYEASKTSTVTDFYQQGHACYNRTTLIIAPLSMSLRRFNYIQITTILSTETVLTPTILNKKYFLRHRCGVII